MSHKENLSPLSITGSENALLERDTTKTITRSITKKVVAEQQAGLKPTLENKSQNATNAKKAGLKLQPENKSKFKVASDNDKVATKTPIHDDKKAEKPTSSIHTNTAKRLVFDESTPEVARRSASPHDDLPLLLRKDDHIHIHHKAHKSLELPTTQHDEKPILALEKAINVLEVERDDYVQQLDQIKQQVKKVELSVEVNKKEWTERKEILTSIEDILAEKEEQQVMLEEILEIMGGFSDEFIQELKAHEQRSAEKEQEIQCLLNTLSQLNYELDEAK